MSHITVYGYFEWDPEKENLNLKKHKLSFETAAKAFLDPHRLIIKDEKHGTHEQRLFCIGKVDERIVTVRFVARGQRIRIIGAGEWRKERKFYEEKNKKRR